MKTLPLRGILRPAADLRLGKGHSEIGIDPHHLSGGFHLGSQHRIDAVEAVEREDRFLDGDVIDFDFSLDAQFQELFADHHLGGHLGPGDPCRLADKGNGSRGPGIDFKDIDDVVLDRILNVHQADHVEFPGQGVGVLLQLLDQFIAQGVGGRDTGAVSGVNSGLLDVFHDAGDDTGLAVRDGIDIDLDGIFQKLVDQDGMLGRGLDGPLDKSL